MKSTCLFSLAFVLVSSMLLAQSNPVPLIYQPLSPASVSPGHAAFTLTVHGTGFVRGAVIKGNGIPLKTKFVNRSTLKAEVPAKAVATARTGSITVANPGSIDSNVIYLPVRNSSYNIAWAGDPGVLGAGEVQVGDFNGDHKPDIIAAGGSAFSGQGSYLDIFFSRGNGQFVGINDPEEIYDTHVGPNPVGDFNNDGNLDVAVSDTNGSSVWYDIFLGDGKGGFTSVDARVRDAGAVADVNGDGKLDFVTIHWDTVYYYVYVFLGNGDGTFTQGFTQQLNIQNVGPPAVGDFNGDGKLDVAFACYSNAGQGTGEVAVLMGNGDGTFGTETDYATEFPQFRLAVADWNGDGKLDIITNGISVLLGNGKGGFISSGGSQLFGSSSSTPEIADMNGDGVLDILQVSTDDQQRQFLNILLGEGGGDFIGPLTFLSNQQAGGWNDLSVADFNNDGMLDVAVSGLPAMTVMLQKSQQ